MDVNPTKLTLGNVATLVNYFLSHNILFPLDLTRIIYNYQLFYTSSFSTEYKTPNLELSNNNLTIKLLDEESSKNDNKNYEYITLKDKLFNNYKSKIICSFNYNTEFGFTCQYGIGIVPLEDLSTLNTIFNINYGIFEGGFWCNNESINTNISSDRTFYDKFEPYKVINFTHLLEIDLRNNKIFGFLDNKKMVRTDNKMDFLRINDEKIKEWGFVVYLKDYGTTEIIVSFDMNTESEEDFKPEIKRSHTTYHYFNVGETIASDLTKQQNETEKAKALKRRIVGVYSKYKYAIFKHMPYLKDHFTCYTSRDNFETPDTSSTVTVSRDALYKYSYFSIFKRERVFTDTKPVIPKLSLQELSAVQVNTIEIDLNTIVKSQVYKSALIYYPIPSEYFFEPRLDKN